MMAATSDSSTYSLPKITRCDLHSTFLYRQKCYQRCIQLHTTLKPGEKYTSSSADLGSQQDTLYSSVKSCPPHRNIPPPPPPGFAISILGKSYRRDQVLFGSKIPFPKWKFLQEVGCSNMSNTFFRWQRGHQDTAACLPAGWGWGGN